MNSEDKMISSEKESCFYYLNKILDNISKNKHPSVNNKEINYEKCIGVIQKCIKFNQQEVIDLFNKYNVSIDFFKDINPIGFTSKDCKSFEYNIEGCDEYIKTAVNKFAYYTYRPIGIPVKLLYFFNQLDSIFINGKKYNAYYKGPVPKSLIANPYTIMYHQQLNSFLINNKIFSINGWLYLNYDKISNYFSEYQKLLGTSDYISKLSKLIEINLIDQFDFVAYRILDAQYNSLDPNIIYSPYINSTNFKFVGRYHQFPTTLKNKDELVKVSRNLIYPTDTLMFYDAQLNYNRFVFCKIPLNFNKPLSEGKSMQDNTTTIVEGFTNKCSDIYKKVIHYFICKINNIDVPVCISNPKILTDNKISKGAVISYVKKGSLYYFKELIKNGDSTEQYYGIDESFKKITHKNKLTLISSEENKNLSLLNKICIFLNMLEVEDLSDIIYKLICVGKIKNIVDLFYLKEKDFETSIEALEFACQFTKNENKFISTNIDGYLGNYKHSLYFWQVLYLYVNNLSIDKARIISYQFNELYTLEKLTDEVIKQVTGINAFNFSKSIQSKKEEIYLLLNKINLKNEYKSKEYSYVVLQKTFGYYNVYKKLLTNLGYLVLDKPIDNIKHELVYVYEKDMMLNLTDFVSANVKIKSLYQLLKKYKNVDHYQIDDKFFQDTIHSYGFTPKMFLGVEGWRVKENYIEITYNSSNKTSPGAIAVIIKSIPEFENYKMSFVYRFIKIDDTQSQGVNSCSWSVLPKGHSMEKV